MFQVECLAIGIGKCLCRHSPLSVFKNLRNEEVLAVRLRSVRQRVFARQTRSRLIRPKRVRDIGDVGHRFDIRDVDFVQYSNVVEDSAELLTDLLQLSGRLRDSASDNSPRSDFEADGNTRRMAHSTGSRIVR